MASRSIVEVLKAIATLDVSGWMASAAKISSSSNQMRADWAKAAKDISTAVNRIGMAVGGMVAGVTAVGFKFNSMAEQAEIAFTTMMGDAEKARKHLKALFDYAARTPFSAEGVIDASRKLQAMGFTAEEVLPTLTKISDAVSGLGGGTPMLDRVVRAIGQMKARSKVSAEEMMQLAENGIAAWQMLADHMGITVAEAMKLSQDGAISADVGITAILTGLEKKFGGMSAKQAATFSGMWATMKDMAEMGAGEITKPLFTAFTKWSTDLMAFMQTGGMTAVLADARVKVQEFVMAIQRGLPGAMAQFRELAPAIVEAANGFGRFLTQLTLFMVEHPKVLAALIALKVAGFLGITQAIMSTLKALASTVTWLFNVTQAGTKLVAVLKALGVALAGLSSGAIAAINVAFLAVVVVVNEWWKALQKVNAELEKGQRLTDKLLALDEKRHRQRMEALGAMQAEERKAALQADIATAEKNLPMQRAAVESAQADLDALNVLHHTTGEIAAAKQKLAENQQALIAAERRLEDMHALLDQTTKDLAGKTVPQGPQLPGQPMPGAPAVPGGGGGGVPGVPGAPLDFNAAVAKRVEELKQQAEKDKIERAAQAQFNPEAQGPQMPENFEAVRSAASELTVELESMAGAGQLSAQQLTDMRAAIDQMASEVLNGTATMQQFQHALSSVKTEAQKAAAAAAAEAEQKRIAALVAGNFAGAGLDFQKAVQERMAAMQLAKFNDAVEKAAKELLGLGDATDKAAKKIENPMAGGGGGGRGGGMSGLDAMGNMSKIFEGANTLFNFLRSTQGQMTSLQWNLQIAQRNLSLAKQSGFSPDRIKFWENMIQQLIQQMHDLVTSPQLFTAFNGEGSAPMDPVLEEARANDPKRIQNVNLSFPNITRISQADSELLYRAVKDVGRRLGDQSDFIRNTRT